MRQIQERGLMSLLCVCCCSVHAKEDRKATNKSRARGCFATKVRHHAGNYDLLHSPAPQYILQRSVVKSVILCFWNNDPSGNIQRGAYGASRRFGADHFLPPAGHHSRVSVCIDVARENDRPVTLAKNTNQRLDIWQNGWRTWDKRMRLLLQKILLHVKHKQCRTLGLKNYIRVAGTERRKRFQHLLGFVLDGVRFEVRLFFHQVEIQRNIFCVSKLPKIAQASAGR